MYVVASLAFGFVAKCEVGSCAKGFEGDDTESFASGANDIILVEQKDGSLKSTILNLHVSFVIYFFLLISKKNDFVPKI